MKDLNVKAKKMCPQNSKRQINFEVLVLDF